MEAAAEAAIVTEPEHTTLRAPLRPPVEDRTAPPEDLPPIEEPQQLTIQPVAGNYVLPSLTTLRPGTPPRARSKANDEVIDALTGVFEQFDVDAAGHRLHPRPDGHPLRGRAGPGGQGRADHPAVPQHRLRGRSRPTCGSSARSRASRAVGVEIPNTDREIVSLGDVLRSARGHAATTTRWWSRSARTSRAASSCANLAKMPHLLIAGATGAGKSSCINSLIVSLLHAGHARTRCG